MAIDCEEICFLSAAELLAAYNAREISPLEVTEALLNRIERINPSVNAYCTIAIESAMESARQAERAFMRNEQRGKLLGIPVAFKDVTETANIRTTFGSPIFANHVPTEDAIVVRRARAAGAILVGKTNTPEFACKGTTVNPLFGATCNPWNLSKTAGGSSGGSAAALAAGLACIAEGNDLAGSVRIPASLCGVVGFRPSHGRIPTYPARNGWTSFSTHGPMARTVADAALFYSVLAGHDPRDPQSIPTESGDLNLNLREIRQVRAAWSATLGYAVVDREVQAIAESAAKSLESYCTVDAAEPALADPKELFIALSAPWRAGVCGDLVMRWKSLMDPVLVERIQRTEQMTAIRYEQAQHERTRLSRCLNEFFETFDILLTPTTSVSAFPIDLDFPTSIDGHALSSQLDWYPHTYPFSLTGQPAISIPAGWTAEGLPVGIQVIGRRYEDEKVLQVAAALEAIRPWYYTDLQNRLRLKA